MEIQNESKINGYPDLISFNSTLKIIEQMNKSICRINIGKEQRTGLFCKIPFQNSNNILSIFITNNHIINQNILDHNIKIPIYIKGIKDIKFIELIDRIKYTNEEYDITIIEIKEKDKIDDFLELDDIILNDIINNNNDDIRDYENETVYAIQYPKGKLSVSYGIIQNIFENKNYEFIHKCCTDHLVHQY